MGSSYIGVGTLRVQKKALGRLDPGFGTWVAIGYTMWVLGARFRSFTWIALTLTVEPSHLFLSRLFFYANFSFTGNSYEEKIKKILMQPPFHAHTSIASSAILSYRCPCPTRDSVFLREGHIITTQWAWLTYLHIASLAGMQSWGFRWK